MYYKVRQSLRHTGYVMKENYYFIEMNHLITYTIWPSAELGIEILILTP